MAVSDIIFVISITKSSKTDSIAITILSGPAVSFLVILATADLSPVSFMGRRVNPSFHWNSYDGFARLSEYGLLLRLVSFRTDATGLFDGASTTDWVAAIIYISVHFLVIYSSFTCLQLFPMFMSYMPYILCHILALLSVTFSSFREFYLSLTFISLFFYSFLGTD